MRTAVLAASLLAAGPASAHAFWLQPDTFRPAAGKPFAVRLHVGDRLVPESEKPFERKTTASFILVGSDTRTGLHDCGTEGKTPFATVTAARAGSYWLSLSRPARTIELAPMKFNDYLAEEGLDAVLAERRQLKEDDRPGREVYRRYLKALLTVEKGDDGWKKSCGHKLEILPLSDPSVLRPGGKLKVSVLLDGKPLPDALIFALRREGLKTVAHQKQTAEDGTAEFTLDRGGMWLVRLVHMRRASDHTAADRESFWSAVTFSLP